MTIAEFIAKWRKVELKERSAAQEHFIDLCRVFEHPTPATADPTGEAFCFEKGAAKHGPLTSSGQAALGFADVWKRGFFGWEYKGKHKDLDAAYDQLLRYRDALESPPLLVLCDLERIIVRTNFTGTVSATHEIPLEALGEPRSVEVMRAVFHNPETLRPGRTSTAITKDAARRVAEIADAMRKRDLDPAAVAHFMDRVIFCLFAEDAGLLPAKMFTRIVDAAKGDPDRFSRFLGQLFEAMANGGEFGVETVRHFNGNLFDDPSVLPLTAEEVTSIAAAARLDWSAVDPSIFGTLFERGLDPSKRSQLGAHFTSREDIELVVDAVVMSALRRDWNETQSLLECLLTTGKKNKPGSAGVPPASRKEEAAGTAALPAKPPRGWHSRGYLPHIDHPGLVQTITFRLADSLPSGLVKRLAERGQKADDPALRREIEDTLDASHGACHLRNPRLATVVQNALLYFDAERYRLLAWCVMPNHVHVMIETLPGSRLDEIVHSWKSFTAKECNRLLNRSGRFWQEDYYDRFIRDDEHLRQAKEYIEQNPVKAGLVPTPATWRFGNAGSAGVSPASKKEEAAGTAALPAKPPSAAVLKKARSEAGSILHRFLIDLQRVKILDPACGSGNFLYVALHRLKDLEKEAILFGDANGLGSFLPACGPWQLYGIEINPYAHDLAQMTVWIGWLQWIRANGFGTPADPILRPLADNIRLMDAILSSGSAGVPPASKKEEAAGTAALPGEEPEWPAVDFIIGNPPFLGGKMLRRELGDAYIDRLFTRWRDRVRPEADLCCYWFEKARSHIAAGKCKRAGLLATQGIRGGANRDVLQRIKETGDIFWAESDRPWILDGANVHVSMVGFDDGEEKARILDGKTVATINANLTATEDISAASRLDCNTGIGFMGVTPAGPFDIPYALGLSMLGSPNPMGRPNSDVVRPYANGKDLNQRTREQWTIDFGVEMPQEVAARYEAPFEFVAENVQPEREKNKRAAYSESWWRYAESRPAMRSGFADLLRYVATCMVAKHRVFVWLSTFCVPANVVIAFARSDDLFFGVLHSRFHEVWALAQGTQLREKESGFRYTPTTCFETFPFPGSAGVPPAFNNEEAGGTPALPAYAAIAAAAKELNTLREAWLNPPEWTRTETLEFPGTVGGPWDRYIDPETVEDRGSFKVGTVRYPRTVARDEESAKRLKDRTLTKLYNARPAWLAACHERLDATVAAAYGWPADLSDEAILERLLELNQTAPDT